MSKTSTQTLALLASPDLRADKAQLAKITIGLVENLRMMRRLRGEEALRGLLAGMMLLRVKHSLPHGQFGAWVRKNVADFGERYVNYLMRLSMAFVDRAKVAKPELLALPGDQTELALDAAEGAQKRFLQKAAKFVGDLSLNELLIKHGIKSVGLKSELADAAKAEGDDDDLTPAQHEQLAREQAWLESWSAAQALHEALIDPNRRQRLTDPKKIEALKATLVEDTKLLNEHLATLRAVKV